MLLIFLFFVFIFNKLIKNIITKYELIDEKLNSKNIIANIKDSLYGEFFVCKINFTIQIIIINQIIQLE
jgi:hypothetical protein